MLIQGIFGIVAKRGRNSMKLIQNKGGRRRIKEGEVVWNRINGIGDQYRRYYERGSSTAAQRNAIQM